MHCPGFLKENRLSLGFHPWRNVMVRWKCGVFVVASIASMAAMGQETVLSDRVYVDPKGFFKIVPPSGWSIREYTADPRGKVDFDATPGTLTAQIKVIGQVSPYQGFEAMLKDVEAQGGRMQARLGGKVDVARFVIDGEPAAKMAFEIPGKLKHVNFSMLRGNCHYTLAYGARPDLFDQYYPVVTKSIESFEPILKERSKEEAARGVVAGAVRRANLYLQLGRKDWARTAVEEGLAYSPANAELLALKKRIEKMP